MGAAESDDGCGEAVEVVTASHRTNLTGCEVASYFYAAQPIAHGQRIMVAGSEKALSSTVTGEDQGPTDVVDLLAKAPSP